MKRNGKRKPAARLTALLLCVLMLFGAAACGKAAPQATPAPAVPTQQLLPAMEQRRILEENRVLWAFDEGEYAPDWYYTFTDLDHNGQMEVLAASTQGSGIFTYANFYEVLPDGSGVKNLYHEGVEIEGPDAWPELIRDSLPCYYDRAADRYYYVCTDDTRDGAAHSLSQWAALCLKDGVAEWEYLAGVEYLWTEAGEMVNYMDAAGNPISQADYDAAVERRFAGMERSELKLSWNEVYPSKPDLYAEPTPAPTPAPAPAASTAAPSGPQVVITKNPTSEALEIGGKTWFIAHAQNALSLTWEMVDPQGNVYSLQDAMNSNPGLTLEAMDKDTLAVSNVPQSLNGWGARARFDGQGNAAYSNVATIYVGDYAAAYGSVIQAYKTAYETGNSGNLQYAFDHNLSEIMGYSNHVGYGLKDLDKDGIPELIIAGIDTDDFSDRMIYDLYTLNNGTPVQLAMSQARNRWYLRTDNLLYNEASGGAGHSFRSLYQKTGTELSGTRCAFTWFFGDSNDGYYLKEGMVTFEHSAEDIRLSEAEFESVAREIMGTIFLPQLTRIA